MMRCRQRRRTLRMGILSKQTSLRIDGDVGGKGDHSRELALPLDLD